MTTDDDRLCQALDASLAAHDFSGVVSIRSAGQRIYARAAGFADRSNRLPNTLDTRFGIASGTKLLTALAVGTLVAAGTIDLDTRLKDVVALDFPHYPDTITLRHLLTHTSGIPDYYDEESVASPDDFRLSIPWYDLKGPRDYLAAFPDTPMKFAPGERFSYSNGGYILLGVAVEALTGAPFQEFVAQTIFPAAGMESAGFFALDRLPERTALGYIDESAGWRTNIYSLPIVGASDGGAFATAGDIDALWDALWSGRILPAALVAEFARPQVAASDNPPTRYGLGLWLRDGETYITGCDAGVSFRARVLHERELSVTVLSNTTHGAWPVLRAIDAVLKENP